MQYFQATTDDLWEDMMRLARKRRFRRQYSGGQEGYGGAGGSGSYDRVGSSGGYGGIGSRGSYDSGNHDGAVPPDGSNPYRGEEGRRGGGAGGNHRVPQHGADSYGGEGGQESPNPSRSDAEGSAPSPPPSLAGPPNLQNPFAGKGAGCGKFCDC